MAGEKECVANPIKFETGRNLPPLLKMVTHTVDAALTIVAKHIFSMVHSFDWSFYGVTYSYSGSGFFLEM